MLQLDTQWQAIKEAAIPGLIGLVVAQTNESDPLILLYPIAIRLLSTDAIVFKSNFIANLIK